MNSKMWMLQILIFAMCNLSQTLAKSDVYMVLMEEDSGIDFKGSASDLATETQALGLEIDKTSRDLSMLYATYLAARHDNFLQEALQNTPYKKLYSYNHVLNGFAVHITAEQAGILEKKPGVKLVEKDQTIQKQTIHTPNYLGLPSGIWAQEGGSEHAGEGVVIGIIDTGIDPSHPSFSGVANPPYGPLTKYKGRCETAQEASVPFCNGKIVGAQHFAAAAIAGGNLNASSDYDSPFDGDGHGTHTASIAAGNHGVPVMLDGFFYGNASGMAPRARLAIYKALYRQFGGYVSDVVAAIDKAVQDGVDILSLSVGPNSPSSSSSATFLNVFDVALLSAVKAGVFVVQAAGNGGPYPRTIVSFSPWITSVGAGIDDRSYPNHIQLGNGVKFVGVGLSPATPDSKMYQLVLAKDAVGNKSDYFFSPNDCQDPSLYNRNLVEGKILICTYSFSFIFGGATISKVASTTANLNAVGFVLAVESNMAGSKFQPVPVPVPGIVITSHNDSLSFLAYYNKSITRNSTGGVTKFGGLASIGNGQQAVYTGSSLHVALYSSRGPDVRNFAFQDADILKPNILAPGSMIWGAWTPGGTDESNFQGKKFAMVSGTSMATPHVAGIAALLKQHNPNWSPAGISSALMTTASVQDHQGGPLLAQHQMGSTNSLLEPATPFDYGAGAINPTAALDPGLIFDAAYGDYTRFLCSVPGIDKRSVFNVTKVTCGSDSGQMSDLNLPSITIASLNVSRKVPRIVTNVADIETYDASYVAPTGVIMAITPKSFTISKGQSISFVVLLQAASTSENFSFGELRLIGSKGHIVRVPISIMRTQAYIYK